MGAAGPRPRRRARRRRRGSGSAGPYPGRDAVGAGNSPARRLDLADDGAALLDETKYPVFEKAVDEYEDLWCQEMKSRLVAPGVTDYNLEV